MSQTAFIPLSLSFRNQKTWIFASVLVVGNLAMPQLCHLIPQGGLILLPIYFFTLIAAYKFGLTAGMLTGIASPLANHLLFGMPMIATLPILLIKSMLLASIAAWVAKKSRKASLLFLALVVVAYQLLGGLAEWGLTGSLAAAVQDFSLGFPGMLLQVLGGWLLLKQLSGYGR